MSAEDRYDPYEPEGENATGTSRTQALQSQIDDTVGVMKDNLNRVAQRGENLEVLQDKTDRLHDSALNFRRGANQVRKQMWWKDMKMRMWIIIGIIVLLLVIILPTVLTRGK